ncbi:fimbrial protein [Citrobacter sp. Awk 4]|uniref:fimbrial protein n=1 Tax=Citrobacter sp. Awk 4 TaxID=2963955 RepID=UPI0023020AED|nr:fimbrial protein [Citrobacter sp. Awk 4]MDA8481353.1 fimbrial protein [Citrobacter sp. Awk 4]
MYVKYHHGYLKKLLAIMAIIFAWACFSPSALAFTCYNGAASIFNGSTTFTVQVDAPVLDKSVTDAIITDMSTYASCYGVPDQEYQDALRSNSLTISSALTRLGYEPFIQMSGTDYTVQPVCLWPDNSCSISGSSDWVNKPIEAKLGITRTSTATWGTGTTLPAGTEIMRLETQMRGLQKWESWYITWVFVLKNDMVIPNYTCELDNDYSNYVSLPDVSVNQLKENGPGKYLDAPAPFHFNLKCDPQTSVSIQFDGATMNNIDSVLANTKPGNDNVGIQLLFNGGPVKIGEKLEVISSAQTNETVGFNALYYYKGGAVGAGRVNSVATFTFDYQ